VPRCAAVRAADWPQWQGPDRARISKETGLLKEWHKDGPSVVWTANNLGTGYGRFYVRNQDIMKVHDIKSSATP
jgi:hypothetical protein